MPRIAIIGAGIIGLNLAFACERRGWDVILIEARSPGYGASSVNAGWIVPSHAGPVPAAGLLRTSMRWMLRSDSPLYIRPRLDREMARWLISFWRNCNAAAYDTGLAANAELSRRTFALYDELAAAGVAFEQHKVGVLFAFMTREKLAHELLHMDSLTAFGIDAPEPVFGDDLRELEPALADQITGGFLMREERHVRPDSLVAGLVRYLTDRGVELTTSAKVIGLQTAKGAVVGVETETGRIRADATVIAAGSWSGELARLAGVRVPIQAGKGYCLDYAPSPVEVRHAIHLHEARAAVTPLDAFTRVAGTMEFSGINEVIRPERVTAIARAAASSLRNWPADPAVAKVGSGLRPMTPDGLPVVGLLPGFSNLAIASGHGMLGLTLAPATADALAEQLTTGQTPEVLRPFDPGRF
ncbi:MAG: NAD(P)/FAD-dependent oxidoreductase [Thermomicrobiales bacterium]